MDDAFLEMVLARVLVDDRIPLGVAVLWIGKPKGRPFSTLAVTSATTGCMCWGIPGVMCRAMNAQTIEIAGGYERNLAVSAETDVDDFLANIDTDRGEGRNGSIHGLLLRLKRSSLGRLLRGGSSRSIPLADIARPWLLTGPQNFAL
jgi:hypothetical protein